MRSMMFAVATLAFASAASAQQAPAPAVAPISAEMQRTVERLRARALQDDTAWQTVEGLVTDIGPRLAGSDAEARARDWMVARLRAQGFTNVHIEPFTIPFWDATREEAHIISPGAQRLVIAALGGSASTPAGGLEAEVVRFTDMAALQAAAPESVRGRIVFVDERMVRAQDGAGYGVAVAKRGNCAPVAQRLGAVACLIRAVGTDSNRFAHQGGSSRQRESAHLPAASVSPADADILARLVARGPVRVHLDIETVTREDAPSGNVIAEIRGRERPNEIVLLAAHLDSWDLGQGAIDDGSGVAIVSAAARLIRELPRRPRRTIRLLIAGSEETGVFGGAAYARAHANDTHIVAAESDFGAGHIYAFGTRFSEAALPYGRAIQRQLAPLGIIMGPNTADGGADISGVRATGVPVVDLSQDGSYYFDYHHTANDTLYAIDPEDLRQNVAAWTVFAYMAAESDWVFAAPAAAPAATQ
ncbi:M28 family peptidase [Terricaulis sp.]|uniref:M28 family peptidase n=1 Tax=Terricaulis sp. TaxID=2768686 RepID=UPI003783287F